jgi:hypothetical protein
VAAGDFVVPVMRKRYFRRPGEIRQVRQLTYGASAEPDGHRNMKRPQSNHGAWNAWLDSLQVCADPKKRRGCTE